MTSNISKKLLGVRNKVYNNHFIIPYRNPVHVYAGFRQRIMKRPVVELGIMQLTACIVHIAQGILISASNAKIINIIANIMNNALYYYVHFSKV